MVPCKLGFIGVFITRFVGAIIDRPSYKLGFIGVFITRFVGAIIDRPPCKLGFIGMLDNVALLVGSLREGAGAEGV